MLFQLRRVKVNKRKVLLDNKDKLHTYLILY